MADFGFAVLAATETPARYCAEGCGEMAAWEQHCKHELEAMRKGNDLRNPLDDPKGSKGGRFWWVEEGK